MMGTRIALEKLQQREQFLTTENEMLKVWKFITDNDNTYEFLFSVQYFWCKFCPHSVYLIVTYYDVVGG